MLLYFIMNIKEIREKLNRIKRTTFGISIPEVRKLARQIAKKDYQKFIENNPNDSFELKILHAFLIGYINADIKEILQYFEDFIPYVDDWAVNDSFCQNFTIARKYQDHVWNLLMKYKTSKKEFESRVVSVVLLSHFINDNYVEKVIKVLDELNTDDYYSQMGVAWAIATVMAKYPDKCLEYLQSCDCNLDKITYNKSLQKIRESLRISTEIKEITKHLRY